MIKQMILSKSRQWFWWLSQNQGQNNQEQASPVVQVAMLQIVALQPVIYQKLCLNGQFS